MSHVQNIVCSLYPEPQGSDYKKACTHVHLNETSCRVKYSINPLLGQCRCGKSKAVCT